MNPRTYKQLQKETKHFTANGFGWPVKGNQVINEMQHALSFVDRLLAKKIPLNCIQVNDWGSSYPYAIYVQKTSRLYWTSRDKVKRYIRFSDYDVKNAFKFYSAKH